MISSGRLHDLLGITVYCSYRIPRTVPYDFFYDRTRVWANARTTFTPTASRFRLFCRHPAGCPRKPVEKVFACAQIISQTTIFHDGILRRSPALCAVKPCLPALQLVPKQNGFGKRRPSNGASRRTGPAAYTSD